MSKHILPNGGDLMVVYHGSIRQKWPEKHIQEKMQWFLKKFQEILRKTGEKLIPGYLVPPRDCSSRQS